VCNQVTRVYLLSPPSAVIWNSSYGSEDGECEVDKGEDGEGEAGEVKMMKMK
jgi:hypothetical protein